MTTRIDRAIDRSSLGTRKAKAARRQVGREVATRIVTAAAAMPTSSSVARSRRKAR
jgi:hypothetical protein